MNKKSSLYKYLKKLEASDYADHGLPYFMNFLMCFSLSVYGKAVYRKLKKEYPNKAILLLPSRSAGDVFYLQYFFANILKMQGIEEHILVLDDAGCFRAAKAIGYDNVVPVSMLKQKALLMYQRANHDKETDIYDCFPWCMFDLKSAKAAPTVHSPSKQNKGGKGTDKCANEPEPGAVIISPYENSLSANGYPLLPPVFWNDLAQEFLSKGYPVYTNCSGNANEPLIPGTKQIFPEISKIQEIVERAGNCVMMRSGFTDYSDQAAANKVILFPNEDCRNMWSVFRTRDVNDCIEIVYEKYLNDYTALIQQICSYIENGKGKAI